jgi:glutathione synthase/RimK-type ligase-like ATP-grasp enzyme
MILFLRNRGFSKETINSVSENLVNEIFISNGSRRIKNPDILVRFGNVQEYPCKGITINESDAIITASNKYKFRKMCVENELSCPKTWYCTQRNEVDKFPVIIRPLHHFGGFNLFFINTMDELRRFNTLDKFYISEYIKKVREIRVYIMSNRILAISEKIAEDKESIAWNHIQGSTFENIRWKDWPRKSGLLAIQAMNMVGLDFGGADIIIDENNISYLLEINTALSINSSYTAELFANGFDYLFDNYFENNNKILFDVPNEALRKYMYHPVLKEE